MLNKCCQLSRASVFAVNLRVYVSILVNSFSSLDVERVTTTAHRGQTLKTMEILGLTRPSEENA